MLITVINCIITNSTGAGRFAITNTKLYVSIVTLSTQDNTKLLQQLKSGFKKTINPNKYQLDGKIYAQNQYLNHLIDSSFQEVNILFVSSFGNFNYLNHVNLSTKNKELIIVIIIIITFRILFSKSRNKRL